MDDNTLIKVKNRNNGTTGYVLPDSNVRRSFAPGESKNIPLGELRSLQYSPGGAYILENLLIVDNKYALEALNMKVEPEYFYTEANIRKILFDNDNMDSFLDFLDFATEGAIEIAKDIAVKEELPDSRKREALSKKTGFSIDNAIRVNRIMAEEEEEKKKAEAEIKERRMKSVETKEATPQRRTTPEQPINSPTVPKYNIVNTSK